jgi:hypothetical protein
MTSRVTLTIRREFARAAPGFFAAWFSLIVAMPAAYILLPVVLTVGYKLFHLRSRTPLFELPVQAIAAAFLAGVFCVVIGPLFLAFRRHIVGPRFPFFRLGYLAVAAVGPAVMALVPLDPYPAAWLPLSMTFYEVPALIGTLLYVALARRIGGFGDEWPRRARA